MTKGIPLVFSGLDSRASICATVICGDYHMTVTEAKALLNNLEIAVERAEVIEAGIDAKENNATYCPACGAIGYRDEGELCSACAGEEYSCKRCAGSDTCCVIDGHYVDCVKRAIG